MNQENLTPFDVKEIIKYQNGSVVSRTLINKKRVPLLYSPSIRVRN